MIIGNYDNSCVMVMPIKEPVSWKCINSDCELFLREVYDCKKDLLHECFYCGWELTGCKYKDPTLWAVSCNDEIIYYKDNGDMR